MLEGDQLKAFDIAINSRNKSSIIAGYAGTGKTTVMAEVANQLGEKCVTLAPTNKAASVLRRKGIPAITIHSAIYAPSTQAILKTDQDGTILYHKDEAGEFLLDLFGQKMPMVEGESLSFSFRDDAVKDAVALVDESSMVSTDVKDDIEAAFSRVVYFGDPAQLPPVSGGDFFGTCEPDVFLRKVHRQAEGNPIIRLATAIRNGENPEVGDFVDKEFIFLTGTGNRKLYPTLVEKNVQAICWTNRLRHEINARLREQKGFPENRLCEGEEVISLKNIWTGSGEDARLEIYNGQVLKVIGNYGQTKSPFETVDIQLIDENTGTKYIKRSWPFWNEDFFTLKDNFQAWNSKLDKEKAEAGGFFLYGEEFDFSYCLTAHKSQGSEFPNVAVWDQRPIMKGDKARWFYTAITRAKEKLLIVQ